ncbi:MAG: hypothetical protein WCF36_08470 [Candidatus Nanopelagicales bacterium]
MPVLTVVLCPALDPGADVFWRPTAEAALGLRGVPVVVPERATRTAAEADDERLRTAAWVADQAVTITAAGVTGPLMLVSAGSANRAVPALALSQRASRHPVMVYVMVDGPLPQPGRGGFDWPDAPVIYVASGAADALASEESLGAAGLRGWSVVRGDPVEAITTIAAGWPDAMP